LYTRACGAWSAAVDHDGSEGHVGEALALGAAEHEDDRDHLDQEEGHGEGEAEGVCEGLREVEAFAAAVAQFDGHDAHAPCGRRCADGEATVGEPYNQPEQWKEEETGEGGEGDNEHGEDEADSGIDDPCDQAFDGHRCIEIGAAYGIGVRVCVMCHGLNY
jgi:hypothetical protein